MEPKETITTEMTESVDCLVKRINEGIATEQESGVALKQLQISLSTGLLKDLQLLMANLGTFTDLRQRLVQRLEDIVLTEVDLMDVDTVMKLLKDLHSMQLDGLEFQRKLIQGKSIYDFNTLSDEEKMVVQLMSSFSSLDEKQTFLDLVRERITQE